MKVVITGAGKGIGLATVKAFAADANHDIISIVRSNADIQKIETDCASSNVKAIAFDLSQTDLQPLIQKILKFFQSVDILINNAGTLVNKSFEASTDTDFDKMFHVNVRTPFLLSQALLPYFKEGSHIVNIGSMGGFQGSKKFKGLSLYSASKGALAILSECMAEELQERKIKVNCLALGSVNTSMLQAAFPNYKASMEPNQMAEFICRFALTGHHHFNGKVIPVSVSTP